MKELQCLTEVDVREEAVSVVEVEEEVDFEEDQEMVEAVSVVGQETVEIVFDLIALQEMITITQEKKEDHLVIEDLPEV